MPDMQELVASAVGIMIVALLVMIVVFLITRFFWCWYYKINARLEEQRKTNELLTRIYGLLAQGNELTAYGLGQMSSSQPKQPEQAPAGTGQQDDSLPRL